MNSDTEDFSRGHQIGELAAAVRGLTREVSQFREQQGELIEDLNDLKIQFANLRGLAEVNKIKLMSMIVFVAISSGAGGGAIMAGIVKAALAGGFSP